MAQRKVTLKNVRTMFLHLAKPQTFKDSTDRKFSLVALISKQDAENFDKMKALYDDAVEYGKEKLWNNNTPRNLRAPWQDGDEPHDNGKERGPECAGHWVLSVNSKEDKPPRCVDRDRNDLTPGDIGQVFYAGCYANVVVSMSPYDQGNRGVTANLLGVQFWRDGERLGGVTADDDDYV